MCGTRCAYCENTCTAIEAHIEHFRPKAGVDADGDLPAAAGYWWLASSWENLLLACPLCNVRRSLKPIHNAAPRPTGKGNRFPLIPGSARSGVSDDVTTEQNLLVDPSAEDPAPYFAFSDLGAITPRVDDGVVGLRASATIEVLGLDRLDLTQHREQQLVKINAIITRANKLGSRLDERTRLGRSAEELEEIREDLRDAFRELENYLPGSNSLFIGMSIYWIDMNLVVPLSSVDSS